MTKTAELSLITVEQDTGRVWATFTLRDAEPGRSDIVTTHGPRAFEPDDDVAAIIEGINADLKTNHGCEPLAGSDRIVANCDVAHTSERVAAVRAAKAEAARLAEEERARQAKEQAEAEQRAQAAAAEAQARYEADVEAMAQRIVAKMQSDAAEVAVKS